MKSVASLMASINVSFTTVTIESSTRSATWRLTSPLRSSWRAAWGDSLRLIHIAGGLILRLYFLKCRTPSVRDGSFIRGRLSSRVIRRSCSSTETVLELVNFGDDVKGAETGSWGASQEYQRWRTVVIIVFYWRTGSYGSGHLYTTTGFANKRIVLELWFALHEKVDNG